MRRKQRSLTQNGTQIWHGYLKQNSNSIKHQDIIARQSQRIPYREQTSITTYQKSVRRFHPQLFCAPAPQAMEPRPNPRLRCLPTPAPHAPRPYGACPHAMRCRVQTQAVACRVNSWCNTEPRHHADAIYLLFPWKIKNVNTLPILESNTQEPSLNKDASHKWLALLAVGSTQTRKEHLQMLL